MARKTMRFRWARVDAPDKLHAQAPVAAGFAALLSLPAALLALVAAPRAGGVQLPPTADARLQLWCIAAGGVIAIVLVDWRFGLGISVRALVTDGFTSAAVAFTVALAATSPVMIFHHVESRDAWLAVAAVQFVWPFAGLFVCGTVSARRKRKLFRFTEDRAKVLLPVVKSDRKTSGMVRTDNKSWLAPRRRNGWGAAE